jgi:SnoaL-like protein
MSAVDDALSIVRAYHDGWTGRHFDRAASLLAEELKVEVPVNAYPTKASFVEALIRFGSMVERADLLAELGNGSEAILLYDMQVSPLGTIRIAEHFTVRDGRIVRIRQIHDTAGIRAAGMGGERA